MLVPLWATGRRKVRWLPARALQKENPQAMVLLWRLTVCGHGGAGRDWGVGVGGIG